MNLAEQIDYALRELQERLINATGMNFTITLEFEEPIHFGREGSTVEIVTPYGKAIFKRKKIREKTNEPNERTEQ